MRVWLPCHIHLEWDGTSWVEHGITFGRSGVPPQTHWLKSKPPANPKRGWRKRTCILLRDTSFSSSNKIDNSTEYMDYQQWCHHLSFPHPPRGTNVGGELGTWSRWYLWDSMEDQDRRKSLEVLHNEENWVVLFCLLWIKKARTKEETYIWVSVHGKQRITVTNGHMSYNRQLLFFNSPSIKTPKRSAGVKKERDGDGDIKPHWWNLKKTLEKITTS